MSKGRLILRKCNSQLEMGMLYNKEMDRIRKDNETKDLDYYLGEDKRNKFYDKREDIEELGKLLKRTLNKFEIKYQHDWRKLKSQTQSKYSDSFVFNNLKMFKKKD
mgnify:CR=1 FL=1